MRSQPVLTIFSSGRAAEASDGRVRRSERSREAIVTALIDLIGGGIETPTAKQVAERGRVGIRTVFRHFSEMESLYAAMDAVLYTEAERTFLAGDRSGAFDDRVKGLVRSRCAGYEKFAPFLRASIVFRRRSAFIETRKRQTRMALRDDLFSWLPELREAPRVTIDGLEMITSFEAWDRLRSDQKLAAKAVHACVEALARALSRDISGRKALPRAPRTP